MKHVDQDKLIDFLLRMKRHAERARDEADDPREAAYQSGSAEAYAWTYGNLYHLLADTEPAP
jgi:hypothetical protein